MAVGVEGRLYLQVGPSEALFVGAQGVFHGRARFQPAVQFQAPLEHCRDDGALLGDHGLTFDNGRQDDGLVKSQTEGVQARVQGIREDLVELGDHETDHLFRGGFDIEEIGFGKEVPLQCGGIDVQPADEIRVFGQGGEAGRVDDGMTLQEAGDLVAGQTFRDGDPVRLDGSLEQVPDHAGSGFGATQVIGPRFQAMGQVMPANCPLEHSGTVNHAPLFQHFADAPGAGARRNVDNLQSALPRGLTEFPHHPCRHEQRDEGNPEQDQRASPALDIEIR